MNLFLNWRKRCQDSLLSSALLKNLSRNRSQRVKWPSMGDRNSKFFQQDMVYHRMKNTILSLLTAQRVKLEEPGAINVETMGFTRAFATGFMMELERDAKQALSVAINRKVPLKND